jgi:hypothetical protein
MRHALRVLGRIGKGQVRTNSMRSFDPRAVGRRECRAWETYYRREWGAFLAASVGLVRAASA